MSDVGCETPSRRGSHIRHPTSTIRHRGFTLAEVTLSIAITSILLLGMGGALMMTVSAADSGDDGPARTTAASEALSSLNAELSIATSISSFTPNSIALTVPDRDADGSPEAIEYSWEKPGKSILRSYNRSTPTTFISDVQTCDTQLSQRPAPTPLESAERVLAQCDAPSGATLSTFAVDKDNCMSQYVRPALPSGTVSWKITKIGVLISKNNASRLFRVSIVTPSAGLKPSTPVLASVSRNDATLGTTAAWVEFALPIATLSPGAGIVIVIDTVDNSKVNVGYTQNGTNQPFNTHMMTSANAGSSWSAPNDTQDMRFILYGTYTTLVEP